MSSQLFFMGSQSSGAAEYLERQAMIDECCETEGRWCISYKLSDWLEILAALKHSVFPCLPPTFEPPPLTSLLPSHHTPTRCGHAHSWMQLWLPPPHQHPLRRGRPQHQAHAALRHHVAIHASTRIVARATLELSIFIAMSSITTQRKS